MRPGKSWRARLCIHWNDGRDPWQVRVTAIGESAILVRRQGCVEFSVDGFRVERLEWDRKDGSRMIEVEGIIKV